MHQPSNIRYIAHQTEEVQGPPKLDRFWISPSYKWSLGFLLARNKRVYVFSKRHSRER